MEKYNCNKCHLVANSLSESCPACGTPFYDLNDRQRILGVATLLCIGIAMGFFIFGQSFPAIAS